MPISHLEHFLIVADPNGITVELNFPAAEAVGLEAPKLALSLGGED